MQDSVAGNASKGAAQGESRGDVDEGYADVREGPLEPEIARDAQDCQKCFKIAKDCRAGRPIKHEDSPR